MTKLPEASVPDLRRALDRVDEKEAALRLVAAIAHKRGVTQTELAEWFGVERKTVYNWLSRLDPDDLVASARDESRPGRPRKLSTADLEALGEDLQQSPLAHGYEVPAWTTGLVQTHLRETYDVEYSPASCRRLLRRAGLQYRSRRELTDEGLPDDWPDLEDESGLPRGAWVPP